LIKEMGTVRVESYMDGTPTPESNCELLFPGRVCFTSEDTSKPVAHEIQRWIDRVAARRWRCKKNPVPPELFECLTALEGQEVFDKLWGAITGLWKRKLEDRFMNPGKFVKEHNFSYKDQLPEYEEWSYIGGSLQRRT
jgi:hypothetical protein